MPGAYRDGSVNELVLRSIMEGMAGLPEAISAATDDRMPFVVWALNDRAADWLGAPRLDWHGDDWLVDEIESFARLVVTSIRAATTPEAKVYLAWLFAALLDIIDRGLLVGHS
jgi:hypothetical protein